MFKKTLRSLTLCVGALIVANSFAEDSSKELYIYNPRLLFFWLFEGL